MIIKTYLQCPMIILYCVYFFYILFFSSIDVSIFIILCRVIVEIKTRADKPDRWLHDLYIESQQGPRSQAEKNRVSVIIQYMYEQKLFSKGIVEIKYTVNSIDYIKGNV